MFLFTTGESSGSSFRPKWTWACKLLTRPAQETMMDCKIIINKYIKLYMFTMRCSNKLKQEWSDFFVDGTPLDTHSSYINETYGFPTAVSHHRFGNMLTTFSKAHFRWPPRSRVISHWRHPNRTQHWWPIRCNSGWRRSSFVAVDSIQWFWCPLKHNCSQEFLVLCVFLLISFVSVLFSLREVGGMENMETCFFLKLWWPCRAKSNLQLTWKYTSNEI